MLPLILCLLALDAGALQPDGRLGGDDLVLGAGVTLTADDQGTIYVLDSAAFKVRVFDKSLKPITEFGARGKGPGEFEEPKVISLTPDGKPAVFDTTLRRLTVFEADGKINRIVRLDAGSVAIYHPAILKDDTVAFLGARSHNGLPVYDLSIFEGEKATNLVRINSKSLDWSKSSQPAFWVEFLENELSMIDKGMPVMTGLDANTIVYSRSNEYKFHIAGLDGKTQKTVVRAEKPRAFTEDARMAAYEAIWNRLTTDPFLFNNMPRPIFERAAAKVEAPPALPIIKAVTRYGGGFAVLAQYDDFKSKGQFDLFSRDGAYIKTVPYSGPANFITGNKNHLFTAGPDQSGDIFINRYRIQ